MKKKHKIWAQDAFHVPSSRNKIASEKTWEYILNIYFGSFKIVVVQIPRTFVSEIPNFCNKVPGNSLVCLTFGRPTPERALADLTLFSKQPQLAPKDADALTERLQSFVLGEMDSFLDVPLDLEHLTDFGRQVIHHCRLIPRGKTLTYAKLAEKALSELKIVINGAVPLIRF